MLEREKDESGDMKRERAYGGQDVLHVLAGSGPFRRKGGRGRE